ncbi:nuclear localized protein 1 [Amblyomma americanum]|uniref:Transcription factor 25 n=2 Tax=Amblyomma americanum TaxID=6943 RepID=A0AAQ4DFN0_AMBAM
MSNRVLKKLQGVNDIGKLDAQSETEDETPNVAASDARKNRQAAANRFELLTGLSAEQSLSDTAKEDDDRENEPPPARGSAAGAPQESALLGDEAPRSKLEKQDSTQSTDSLKRRKKKKKKKKQLNSQHSHEDRLHHTEDEVAASVREVNRMLGEPENLPHVAAVTGTVCGPTRPEKSLLTVDQRNLNPENEMRRIFGSRVVQSEKRRGRGRVYGRTAILVPGRNWRHIGKPGISMELVETQGDVHFFTFEHSKSYQAIQFQFLDAVETFNPDNIVALLNQHPYHVDSLIQFSDVCKMSEDLQMAAELIERALYCLESCFHMLFNVTQGNCRLDYRRSENRSLFLALFKHLNFVGQRGCSRTALEFCKLLLGLDPENDPLCVTLLLDYYAIRADQYQYLVRLYHEWDAERNLCQLPNFAFSVPLALFHLARGSASEGGVSTTQQEADKMLQESLIMFPGVLMPLLDKCGVQPDSEVTKHGFFAAAARAQQPAALNQLQSLFVGRNYVLWKEPEVLAWLERNVRAVLKRVDQADPLVTSSAEKRMKRYQGAPRNLCRHIILSNIQEASVTLPQELSNSPIFGFDPLPPADAIVSYTRPPRAQQIGDQSMMGAFFRSLLPSFNLPEEVVGIDVQNPMVLVEPGPAEQGAVGAAEADGVNADAADLRRSVTSLLEAMRDLLSSIHLPSDVPNDGDVDSDDEHED